MNSIYEYPWNTVVSIMDEKKPTKNVSVTVRIDEETWALLSAINEQDRRGGVSEVARLLLERGTELWRKDGRLFDPKEKAVNDDGKKENGPKTKRRAS